MGREGDTMKLSSDQEKKTMKDLDIAKGGKNFRAEDRLPGAETLLRRAADLMMQGSEMDLEAAGRWRGDWIDWIAGGDGSRGRWKDQD